MDQQVAQGSPRDTQPPSGSGDILGGLGSEPAPSRAPRVLGWVGAAVVVLAGLYVGAQWLVADDVPHGTTVAGVPLGGMKAAAARQALTAGLADAQTEPVAVVADGKRSQLDPVAAGLTVDVAATVDPLVSFTLSPQRLWRAAFGASAVDPVVTVDAARLDAQLDAIATAVDKAPVDGAVAFVDGSATSTAPRDGTTVDRPGARSAITAGWLRATGPIELPTRVVHPEIGRKGTQDAMVLAGTVSSAPVDVRIGSRTVRLPGDVVGRAASFTPDGSGLALALDGKALRDDVLDRTTKLLRSPRDASFAFADGRPVVKEGAAGTALDPATLASAVAAAAVKPDGRTATVALSPVQPTTTGDDLRALGVTTVVSEFATPITNEPVRTENLTIGAKKITGVLVRPGGTFSALDSLGPITTAGGYKEAHVIENGQFVDGVGGGLSQVATTTYNAAFLAGLEIVTHKPHSYWFPRYPEGREATLSVPSIDMKFTNDTPTGIVVRAWVGGGQFHVQLWGTPYYQVTSTTSDREDVVQPTTVDNPSPSCVADGGGSPGFTVHVRRVVTHDGATVKDETNTWRYLPENRVVCTGGATPTGGGDR